jgi:hypothetical protein
LSNNENNPPRSRISERTYGVIGAAVGVPVGIGGALASVWAGVFAVREPQVIINIVYGTALIFGVVAFATIAFLIKESLSTEKALRETEKEKSQLGAMNVEFQRKLDDALAQKQALEWRFSIVAMPLLEVSEAMMALEESAKAYRDYAPGSKVVQIREKRRDDLNACWNAAFLAVCEAAASVLPIKKGEPFVAASPTCSANIKIIDLNNDVLVYRVAKRSSHSNRKRIEDDQLPPREVLRNMMYHDLIHEEGVVVINDVDEYLARMDASPALLSMFDEPRDSRFYKSCLIAPIFGPRTHPRQSGERQPRRLIGILCVDSLRPNFFDKDFDQTVVTQLANHAQTCLRLYAEALTSREFL